MSVKRIPPLAVTARTLTTAVGRGADAMVDALRARRSGLRPCRFRAFGETEHVMPTWIGEVDGLDAHRIPEALADFDCRNNRLLDVALGQDGFAQRVERAARRYGADRVAVIAGTSTAGLLQAEAAYARRDAQGHLPPDFHYLQTLNTSSTGAYTAARLGLKGPTWTVSTACSSGAKAFAAAERLIRTGVVDAAVVGACDSLCLTTLAGFDALQLLSKTPCRPFDLRRDGISIGEGAAFALLERPDAPEAADAVRLVGYGESSDAHHMSSPHPSGLGAELAMRDALARAGLAPGAVDYLNLHGTATPANDQSEGQAVHRLFGDALDCSSTKAWFGHLLGAAGAVEAIVCLLAIEHGLKPGTLQLEQPDPGCSARVLVDNLEAPVRVALSNSFGFGGSNCSLVFARADR